MPPYRELEQPAGRLYAVGDLHGCAAELETLLQHLISKEKLKATDLVVFIGDYIDRGPDSKVVVDRLVSLKSDFPNTSFLKGNHEDMLASFLGFGGQMGDVYLANGGNETLQSYALPKYAPASAFLESIPENHKEFYNALERYLVVGNFVFVHAGLDPLRALQHQVDDDLFWIRDEFINNIHYFDKTVIFGHTPYQDVVFHVPYKIGIDTGVVFGNKLSCIELTEGRILQVNAGSSNVITSNFPK